MRVSVAAAFVMFRMTAQDSFELEQLTSELRSHRRRLVELEEIHASNADHAADMMSAIAAQTQAGYAFVFYRLSSSCHS